MSPLDPASARVFLEAVVAASAVLGGGMAYASGMAAAGALAQEQPPEVLAHRINEGIADGFESATPLSIVALIIVSVDAIARFIKLRRSALIVGTATALLVLMAIVLGAPAWILVPAVWISTTIAVKSQTWADRRLGPK